MNIYLILLIIFIPILSIFLIVLSYKYIKNFDKQKRIIKELIDDQNEILEAANKRKLFSKKQKSWLDKKLAFAGFLSPFSEIIFILLSILFGIFMAIFINFLITNKFVLIASFFISSFLPLIFLKKITISRQEEFNHGLKIIIDKITSMMKSGLGFEQSLKRAVSTSKSKLTRDIFDIYLSEKDIIGEDKAFEKMFKLVESKELRIFYLTVSIGKQSGGKFSNTLNKLRKTLHDQIEIKKEIMASTKEIKIGSYMIIGLVIFTYQMINSTMNNALDRHFFGSSLGQIQMFFIILWICIGLYVNNILTKVK